MPVSLSPILIPLILVWGAITYFLFQWRRLAGGAFLVLSVICLVVVSMNTNVERRFDEQMSYRLLEIGSYGTVEVTTSHGDKVLAGSSEFVTRLRGRTNNTVRVVMSAWYDFGRLRAFHVQSIDGVNQ